MDTFPLGSQVFEEFEVDQVSVDLTRGREIYNILIPIASCVAVAVSTRVRMVILVSPHITPLWHDEIVVFVPALVPRLAQPQTQISTFHPPHIKYRRTSIERRWFV
jgi:hypothetical protein